MKRELEGSKQQGNITNLKQYKNSTEMPDVGISDEGWTQEKTARDLGINRQRVTDAVKIAEAIEQKPEYASLKGSQILRRAKQDKFLEQEITKPVPSNVKLLEGDMLEQINNVPDNSIDLLLTDPPYGVMTDYKWDATNLEFLIKWIKAIKPKFKSSYSGFIFCDARMQYDFETIIRNHYTIKNRLIWIRKNMAKGRVIKDRFISSYEVIFFIGNRELNLPIEWGAERFDSFEFAVPQSNFNDTKLHPTQKPLELIKMLASVGSFPNESVLDCFAGSGTTGIACEEIGNRKCTLIEKEPEYIDIIKRRFNGMA